MSGRHISKQQAKLYMRYRQNSELTQEACSAKAGISTRSGYSIEQGKHHTQKPESPRQHKTRTSPIDKIWEEELLGMLKLNPDLQPMTLFIHLERTYLGEQGDPLYGESILRTLQRKVAAWKAEHGSGKPVIFPQSHCPGQMGLSDFTHMDKLGITICGVPFKHMLYHFRLVYSKWSHVMVVQGGESFQALSQGLQQALIALGGAPKEHRTDSLSAAYKNLSPKTQEDMTAQYEALCSQYGMIPTRNNKGISHENGSVESSHGHLKNRIAQELILRGSCDFEGVSAYECWLQNIVANSNRRNNRNIQAEKQALQPLPDYQCIDYEIVSVNISKLSMIIIKNMTYSVPSRLSGHTITVHIYQDRLELYLGSVKVESFQRHYQKQKRSRYVIDYRHVIHSLVKKPGAFRHCKYRDELLPNTVWQEIWKYIDMTHCTKTAPKLFLRLLKLASDYDCEASLGQHVMELIRNKQPVHVEQIESLFNRSNPGLPESPSVQHALSSYDCYIPNSPTPQQGENTNADISGCFTTTTQNT